MSISIMQLWGLVSLFFIFSFIWSTLKTVVAGRPIGTESFTSTFRDLFHNAAFCAGVTVFAYFQS